MKITNKLLSQAFIPCLNMLGDMDLIKMKVTYKVFEAKILCKDTIEPFNDAMKALIKLHVKHDEAGREVTTQETPQHQPIYTFKSEKDEIKYANSVRELEDIEVEIKFKETINFSEIDKVKGVTANMLFVLDGFTVNDYTTKKKP